MEAMQELEVVKIRTDQLLEYRNNAKLHPAEQVDQIAESIEKLGFNNPILAWHNEDGEPEIVAGHGRLMAARNLGIEEVPVIFLDHMNEEQRRAYILIDNKLNLNSGFDFTILDSELESITSIDMEEFGFDLDGILTDSEIEDFFIETVRSNEERERTEQDRDQTEDNDGNQTMEDDGITINKTIVCPHCGEVIKI